MLGLSWNMHDIFKAKASYFCPLPFAFRLKSYNFKITAPKGGKVRLIEWG
jgi:hypothetical protein